VASQETFSREYVQELRQEAAKARTAKKEALEQLRAELNGEFEKKQAGSDTKYTELQTDLGKAWVELQKLYSAIDNGIPTDKVRSFVSVLQGSDEESISKSVATAKELFGDLSKPSPAHDPTQGQGGKNLPLNGDPLLAAVKKMVGAK
jgi:hypothetical protein